MSKNNFLLNRLFTRNILKRLLQLKKEKVYEKILLEYNCDNFSKTNLEFLENIYKYMSENYRNEYFYQNTLFNKLLLGRHSLNTTTALTQIPIGSAKADFIMINGKAIIYEIKTELDSFERLENQIKNYYKGFNFVCIVTCEKNYKKLLNMFEKTKIGIYILTDKNRISRRKEPQVNNEYLDYEVIFKYLRKEEFENIVLKYYKILPRVAPVFYYDECFKLLKNIPIEIFYNEAISQLKTRKKINIEKFAKIPYELKSLIYFYNPSIEEYVKLNNFLKMNLMEEIQCIYHI